MTDDRLPDGIKAAWQNQDAGAHEMTSADITARTGQFRSKIKRRNLIEYAAALLVVAAFGAYFFILPGAVARAGCVLVILGTLYVVWQLYRRGGVQAAPADPAEPAVAFQRRELVRQRDLLRDIWRWYFGPFVPGLATFIVGTALEGGSGGWVAAIIAGTICALVLFSIWRLNKNAAERIEAEITELDSAIADDQAEA